MKWEHVIEAGDVIDINEAKTFFETHSASEYLLVDVRQPGEYSKSHIPGAVSMPLNNLVSGDIPLPEESLIFIYSRKDNRSQAAAQWFRTQGYPSVKRIQGGMDAWQGNKAFGPPTLNLDVIRKDAEFADAIGMAYAMEEGLRQFYLEIAKETEDPTYKKLYRKLASFEVEHKQDLARAYQITEGRELIEKELEEKRGQIMEGGGLADETLIRTLADTESPYDVFSLAIAFETQAFDFYVRLSGQAEKPETKTFFLEMADAEQKHLAFVSEEMDKYLKSKQPDILEEL